MTFDTGLHEVCVGVPYIITKFSRLDSLPNFIHGAPLRALRVRESSANNNGIVIIIIITITKFSNLIGSQLP